MSKVTIDLFSDPICPWCMIGKRRLDRAVAAMRDDDPALEVVVRWRVFQLNPTMPEDGMDRAAYLSTKFGGADRAREIYRVIGREGAGEGIAFAFDIIRRTPNTMKAHALLRTAAAHGVADDVAERLFTAYFLDGRNIGEDAVLSEIAAAAGMPDGVAQRAFGDTALIAELRAEDAAARAQGIAGVPFFVIDGRFALSGAAAPEALTRSFELAAQTVA